MVAESNKANTYFAGFYRQWSYKGVKSESLQIGQRKIFANQIDIVSRITNKIIIIEDANLDSTTWNNKNVLNKKIAVPLKNSLEQNGILNEDSIGNTYLADHVLQNGKIPESALDHVYYSRTITENVKSKSISILYFFWVPPALRNACFYDFIIRYKIHSQTL